MSPQELADLLEAEIDILNDLIFDEEFSKEERYKMDDRIIDDEIAYKGLVGKFYIPAYRNI